MTITLTLPTKFKFPKPKLSIEALLAIVTTILAILTTILALRADVIVIYGDAESHLNIAKRVVSSITPGASQLGGVWLPVPHIMMLPFIWSDTLWRTGLAGSIVSGFCYVISTIFIYKNILLITNRKYASIFGAMICALNPNVLYMQTTPMSELPLIMFFVLSTYYFSRFLLNDRDIYALSVSGFFSFLATLSRYDGWFLVGIQGLIIIAMYIRSRKTWPKMFGKGIFFGSIALFGVLLWLLWNLLILGDPLYFTNSEYSAKTQQNDWRSRGQLPAYHDLGQATLYYTVTAMTNSGFLIFFIGLIGYFWYLRSNSPKRNYIAWLFAAPYLFYILTLYIGQSDIFIPHVTPIDGFEWRLFNVRYGIMMVPAVAISIGFLWTKLQRVGRNLIILTILVQYFLFAVGYSPIQTLADGTSGLSQAKKPDAERWLKEHYDHGLVLIDDYARLISIIRAGLPMQNIIYIGNKPYWEESLSRPERYARWIIAQKGDAVWAQILKNPAQEARLYTFFNKVYTSPDILIFRRIENKVPSGKGSENETGTFWRYQCIDTMKVSRDSVRAFIEGTLAWSQIANEVELIAKAGANCVAVATPYDPEFLPVLKEYVRQARKHQLQVFFRGNFSRWEGWFGYPRDMTTDQHLQATRNFILENADLFRDGDIFTGAPEAENGGPFAESDRNKFPAYRQFLLDQYRVTKDAFNQINKNIRVNWFSMNGWIAQNMYDKQTLSSIENQVTIDHYTSSPEKMAEFLNYWHKEQQVKVALGEFGAPIPDLNGNMTPTEQAAYLKQLFQIFYTERENIEGLNYWTLRYGSTAIIQPDFQTTPAYEVVANYFSPGIVSIQVNDPFGNGIDHVKISALDSKATTQTDQNGVALIRLPAGEHQLKLTAEKYQPQEIQLQLERNGISSQNITLMPTQLSRWDSLRIQMRNFFLTKD
jgi:hypothetical protein